ncbi:chorion peroxidase-like [Epargyreus clarus]|uniref:chorion peroxidase-like n=1 Tax=Epargyreus clarus TaxID=520877 RepID=UPI003C2EEF5D
MSPVQRFLPPVYSDGIQAPRRSVFGSPLPSAREISALIHEDHNVENPSITHLLMQWGQFLDHDVTSTSQSRGFNGSVPRCCKDGGRDFIPKEFLHPECMPIPVPQSDPFYGPRGVRCLDFIRSSPGPRDDCALGWREQMNQVSAYIDGSPLYASSARQSDKLRLFRNGMLQYGRVQQRRPLLPREHRDELCRGGAVSTDCFKSGDGRVNEHPGLVAAHIVWLRQHNRMAQELAHLNPHWSDEKIYQETRKIIGAMLQHITYREFLPVVLGTEVMSLFELEPLKKGYYKDYNPKINPSPASSFGSAAFRFGHSLVQASMVRFDRFHRPLSNNVSLHDELTNPSNIWSMGAVDRLLLGMLNQPAQRRDEFITQELTNHLFQTPHFDFGMDLAAINIQRGRDHGVAPYTAWREPCGLSAIVDFDDLMRVMPMRVVRKLKVLYRHVDDIDLFTGGMAERPVVGGLVGPTFACIIAQQFSNVRKGDRFWYENGGFESSFTPAQLQQIRRISLAQVLCRTLDTIDSVQPFVFLSPNNPDNERISCLNGLLNNFDLSPWVEINTDTDFNNIKKSDDDAPIAEKPKRPKSTTTVRPTTKKPPKGGFTQSQRLVQKKPATDSNSTKSMNHNKPNKTVTTVTDKNFTHINHTKTDTTKSNVTKPNLPKPNVTQPIDDKLDFKNKSRRYDFESDRRYSRPAQYNDYEDDVQSVQAVVVNNLQNKRPYNRPYLTVTENIDKYTYLINYVPRPTQSWRQTTRRNYDRDVVKVTYQNYDNTYRRPNRPYYNRHEYDNEDVDSRNSRPTQLTDFESRSNDDATSTTKAQQTTESNKITSTTENLYKLVTFGYIGTYRGDMTDDKLKSDSLTKTHSDNDSISKDFNTYDIKKPDVSENDDITDTSNTGKLSTFILYDTVTKPYNIRRRHDDQTNLKTNKYYYLGNVLHKYPDNDSDMTKTDLSEKKEDTKKNTTKSGVIEENLQERSVSDKMESFDEIEPKSADPDKTRPKVKKPSGPAKTPSVAFQIIPSENSPSQWAVYDEKEDLPDSLPHKMPIVNVDPYALREIPRPMNLNAIRRRPGRA